MEDLISVIVPIYNRDRYLHETILSVINQTYTNLEIILIDDGSSDNVLKIIKHYEKLDKRIKVITQKKYGNLFNYEKCFSFFKWEVYS